MGDEGVREDITERKKIDVMKREFISVVSHELRTPLTSIMGSVGLVLGGVAGGLPKKAEEMLNIANSNAQRLLYLINDMLDLEKIESGHMELVMELVDAAQLAEESIQVNMPYAEKYNVGFVLEPPPPETEVWGSREGLMQGFANLLSNAAKFSPAGGVVEVSVNVLESGVRLAVTDQGAGIPLEAQEKIFDKFTQLDSSDSRSKDGTGLGLSIARAIIRQHGREMNLESEPGKGSGFYFDLPFRSNPDMAADPLLPDSFGGEPPGPA